MRHRLAVLLVSTLLAAVLIAVPVSPALAKSCRAGFTHAVVGGAQKCLHGGEYCAAAYRSTYRRYGYVCQATGRLRRG